MTASKITRYDVASLATQKGCMVSSSIASNGFCMVVYPLRKGVAGFSFTHSHLEILYVVVYQRLSELPDDDLHGVEIEDMAIEA